GGPAKKRWRIEDHLVEGLFVIEVCCLVIAVASVVIAIRLNHVAKLLEENRQREEQAKRVRNLEPIK
ncbi:MAG: hypothetical protein DME76_04890, partial [Verrucomicrobia bacterium]